MKCDGVEVSNRRGIDRGSHHQSPCPVYTKILGAIPPHAWYILGDLCICGHAFDGG